MKYSTELKTRLIEISLLKNHPKNYREHPDDQLEHIIQSIKEHGFYRNVVLARDHTILAGHGVVKASIKLGLTHVPAITLTKDVDPSTIKPNEYGLELVQKKAYVKSKVLRGFLNEKKLLDSKTSKR